MTIIFLGDSLFDIGNISATVAPFGLQPFPTPPYNQGKASNGQVLGEAMADRFGINANSLVGNSMIPTPPNPLENNVVYAFGGATSGIFGSKANNLDTFPIGLLSQIQLFQNNLVVDNAINNTIEVFISAGSNDVLEVIADPNFVNIFLTPENDDNELLINQTVDNIFNNINQGINQIDNQIKNITVIGLPPVGNTPSVKATDKTIDNSIPLDIGGKTSLLLNDISAKVNEKLIATFDDENNDIPNVKIIDGFQVFNDGLTLWQNDLNTSPIIDISYVDYLSGTSNLEENLTIEQFAFIDGVHPTSALNQYLASEIVSIPQLNTPIYSFQNSNIPTTFLYVAEEEKKSVMENYSNFTQTGIAFNVAIEPNDNLISIYRFQNQDIVGTYLYVGEDERQNILQNYPNFMEEGIAFYVYGAQSNQGENIYRFQNQDIVGTYLYVGEDERQNILQNSSNFMEEGIAFKVSF